MDETERYPKEAALFLEDFEFLKSFLPEITYIHNTKGYYSKVSWPSHKMISFLLHFTVGSQRVVKSNGDTR